MGTRVLALYLCVAIFLVFLGQRIGDRARIADQGVTVLVPLMPFGTRDISHGELIKLVYDTPEILARVQSGKWPSTGTLKFTLDPAHIAHSSALYEGDGLSAGEVVVNYTKGTKY